MCSAFDTPDRFCSGGAVSHTEIQSNTASEEPIDDRSLLQRAELVQGDFQLRIKDVPYEDKGVFFSEMLFVLATVGPGFNGRVLESGRARGQSTFVLGQIFPDADIISVEFDKDSPDAPVAEERLKAFDHVKLLYGDSRRLLFEHLTPNAVAIIDGPKGFRAIRLAFQLLRTGKVGKVFIHDVYKGLATRRFLERHVPGTVFSDHAKYVERFKHLDDRCWEGFDTTEPMEWHSTADGLSGEPSYGPTFACLSHDPRCAYNLLLGRLHLANVMARADKSVNKKLRKRGGA